MHILVFCHVEDVARNQQAIEAAQVEEAEGQDEQQLQESEVAEEDQVFETDLANPDLQQGKPRFILNPVSYIKV